ncbi:MAG: AraC family transcriptional regulator [Fluviicoccus sp.]|uniref:AraC family transcriptional regulator n=1 Tax=Fluviicoccus sp. TaxID=2003552 RepID=UPI00272636A2|nr:AraC family transcriptional regulator [Fluviicoccus sp.]MDO8331554.1 AraC family transcriptional regulator [Fluviicoccus sp.]
MAESLISDAGVAPGDTVLASLLQHILSSAAVSGLPTNTILTAAGIPPVPHADSTGRVPVSHLERLVCTGVAVSGDPLLGLHMSKLADPTGFGVLGYLRQACTTLQDFIEMARRYEVLVSDIGYTSLRHQPGVTLWCWDCKTDNPLFRRQATEYLLGSLRTIQIRMAKQHPPPILRVLLRHEPPSNPAHIAEYEHHFGCPILFNQPVSAMVLANEVLKQPLENPDPGLQQVLEQHALQLIGQREKAQSFMDKARTQLQTLLQQGDGSREALAGAMGMSGRNLHRQFEREGGSYRQLYDEVRLEMARRYLLNSPEAVESVAMRLQFGGSQSFIRWFRQLSGETPGQYRKQARGE